MDLDAVSYFIWRGDQNRQSTMFQLRLPIEVVVALGREGKQHAQIDPNTHPYTVAMATRLQTDQGRAAYRRRKWIAEPPNGWIKSVLGFRQFSLRGLHRVKVSVDQLERVVELAFGDFDQREVADRAVGAMGGTAGRG